MAAREI